MKPLADHASHRNTLCKNVRVAHEGWSSARGLHEHMASIRENMTSVGLLRFWTAGAEIYLLTCQWPRKTSYEVALFIKTAAFQQGVICFLWVPLALCISDFIWGISESVTQHLHHHYTPNCKANGCRQIKEKKKVNLSKIPCWEKGKNIRSE